MFSDTCGLQLLFKEQVLELMFIGLELFHAYATGRLVVAFGDGVNDVANHPLELRALVGGGRLCAVDEGSDALQVVAGGIILDGAHLGVD